MWFRFRQPSLISGRITGKKVTINPRWRTLPEINLHGDSNGPPRVSKKFVIYLLSFKDAPSFKWFDTVISFQFLAILTAGFGKNALIYFVVVSVLLILLKVTSLVMGESWDCKWSIPECDVLKSITLLHLQLNIQLQQQNSTEPCASCVMYTDLVHMYNLHPGNWPHLCRMSTCYTVVPPACPDDNIGDWCIGHGTMARHRCSSQSCRSRINSGSHAWAQKLLTSWWLRLHGYSWQWMTQIGNMTRVLNWRKYGELINLSNNIIFNTLRE